MFEEFKRVKKEPEPLSVTMTGEPYQPARLYYQVQQKNAVIGRFKRLRCIDFDETRNRWIWLYTEEAKNLKFSKSYREIPKQYRPIVLGSFTFKGDQELRLDVRSFKRVTEAILFVDQKINRRLAKLTKIKIVNKLFPATIEGEEMSHHHRLFFEQCEAVNPQDEIQQIEEIASEYEDLEERYQVFSSYFEQQAKKPLPEVEELEAHFYEDGIESITMSLNMRHIEATEHWKGNKSFSRFDLIEKFVENFEDEEL